MQILLVCHVTFTMGVFIYEKYIIPWNICELWFFCGHIAHMCAQWNRVGGESGCICIGHWCYCISPCYIWDLVGISLCNLELWNYSCWMLSFNGYTSLIGYIRKCKLRVYFRVLDIRLWISIESKALGMLSLPIVVSVDWLPMNKPRPVSWICMN